MKRAHHTAPILSFLIPFFVFIAAPFAANLSAAESPLKNMKKEHPRLLADKSTWSSLNERRKSDPLLHQVLNRLEANGRALLDQPLVPNEKQGRRLLAASRAKLGRTVLWSFNYRITGDEVFLRRAEKEMLAAAEFPDWNPSHFLDTAEMTAALAIGYDWLYDKLDPKARETIRKAIVEKGLNAMLSPTDPGTLWWEKSTHNWNQVCYGGMVLGALAVADTEPSLATQVLQRAKQNNPRAVKTYLPDGVGFEGPGYWSYGTIYQVLLAASLQSALGTDWGLATDPGLDASAAFVLQTTGPSGRFFNFSDGGEKSGVQPALFWFARKNKDTGLLGNQFHQIKQWLAQDKTDAGADEAMRYLPLIALWWPDTTTPKEPHLPLQWLGRGQQPLAIFRTSWTDSDSMWLALKGGSASLNHAHMDAGSFVFEADGERWAKDLGAQNYHSLESKGISLWDKKQESDRWKIFRLNNHSHNVITINGQLHRVDGASRIVGFSDDPETSVAILDLTPVYAGQATQVTRGYVFRPKKHVLVRDEIEGLKPGDTARWAMVTEAMVSPDGTRATLTLNGKKLEAKLLSPAKAHFESIPADPPKDDFNVANPGTNILIVKATAPASGRLEFNVLLTPGAKPPTDEPLAKKFLAQWPGRPVP
jgi:hypothetical protein